MVLRPVGDLPPRVYWVRRLVLLVLLLVVAALVWWILPVGGDGGQAAPTPQTPTSESPTPSPTPTPSKSPKATASVAATRTQQEVPECADDAIEVTVEADAETYPPGRLPSFTLAVENVSKETCSRDVGQPANELRVMSGGARVWSSDDCNPGGSADVTVLDPEDRFVQTVSWSRVASTEGCPTPAESAPPGTYQVIARNGEVLSEPAAFVLE